MKDGTPTAPAPEQEESRRSFSIDLLGSLAARLTARAVDIDCAHARTYEEKAVRRSMVVIYSELAEMLREEIRKLSNDV